jgi:hypothetical protein
MYRALMSVAQRRTAPASSSSDTVPSISTYEYRVQGSLVIHAHRGPWIAIQRACLDPGLVRGEHDIATVKHEPHGCDVRTAVRPHHGELARPGAGHDELTPLSLVHVLHALTVAVGQPPVPAAR